jgi:energy-coupling factor transport system ATP-binding protein
MIELQQVNYQYPTGADGNSLSDFSLRISKGEFIVLCGRSGCGKTTVTRLLNGLIPHFYEGALTGKVTIEGHDVTRAELSQTAKLVGSVFQNPKSQFFNVDTDGELAFGCENMALPRDAILSNVKKAVRELGLDGLLGRSIFHLSGGEKQQIACGSVYATNPRVYVLDEPSSNMDAKAIGRLQSILTTLKNAGNTIVVSEHRLHYLTELADRFIYVQDGKAVQSFSPKEMRELKDRNRIELGLRPSDQNSISYTGDGVRFREKSDACPAIQMNKLHCRRGNREVLNISELEIPLHSVVAIIGDNGAGKSTLVETLSGFLKHKGHICMRGKRTKRGERTQRSYMVMQDVNRQLFCSSVRDEILLGLSEGKEQCADGLIEDMGLSEYKDRHPASLSGGQKQRVAICAAIAAGKEFLFYDEPTSGLDFDGMDRLCKLIRQNAEAALSTLVITHDFELIMGCCTHVLHLDKGRVVGFYPLDIRGIEKMKSCFILPANC